MLAESQHDATRLAIADQERAGLHVIGVLNLGTHEIEPVEHIAGASGRSPHGGWVRGAAQ